MMGERKNREIRCGQCNRMLAKGMALDLSIICPRCGTINHVRDTIPSSEPHDGQIGATSAHPEKKN